VATRGAPHVSKDQTYSFLFQVDGTHLMNKCDCRARLPSEPLDVVPKPCQGMNPANSIICKCSSCRCNLLRVFCGVCGLSVRLYLPKNVSLSLNMYCPNKHIFLSTWSAADQMNN
jgi:hypothetical protein